MKSIETFNRQLNQTDNQRFENWRQYRLEATGYILDAIRKDQKKTDRVIILGAGNMDDLDLMRISTTFSEVVLADIDLEAMGDALVHYDVKKNNVRLKQVDFTGLEKDPYWNDFLNQIQQSRTTAEIQTFLDRIHDTARNNTFLLDDMHKYDVVIVSPIYTQLLFRQMLGYSAFLKQEGTPDDLLRYLENGCLEMMPSVLDAFNRNAASLMNYGGMVVVMSDVFEAGKGTLFLNRVRAKLGDTLSMDDLYDDYVSEYGTGIGDYGFHYYDKRFSLRDHRWFEWPLDSRKSLIVKIAFYQS